MIIKFFVAYSNVDGSERNLASAQEDLLAMWQYHIRSNNIKFIQAAKLYFNSYLINEYHDQPKLKQYLFEICPTVPAEEGIAPAYMCQGKYYTDFDGYYAAMARADELRVMELVIYVEGQYE